MPTETERLIIEKAGKVLRDTLELADPPPLPACLENIDCLRTLYTDLLSLRDILYAASMGDFSPEIPFKGYIRGTLKTLQAHLKHITWQTKMIASGDFSQRVDFMGEFSDSFNAMVIQLEQTLNELENKKSQISQVNTDLLKEIAIRKKTEVDLLKSREKLQRLARTDSLTGLFNRGHFNTVAAMEIKKALRYSRPLSVMIFDIDHFKRVNDTFGHNIGDIVLKKVARTSAKSFRGTDTLARYGGEEFIGLLQETIAPGAAKVAERLRREIEKAVVQTKNGPISVTASFGVSDCLVRSETDPGADVMMDFIYTADAALYASKQRGRNRVTVFDPKLEPSSLKAIER
jgi:diguanylate cyclase (GGDEF)-like protein